MQKLAAQVTGAVGRLGQGLRTKLPWGPASRISPAEAGFVERLRVAAAETPDRRFSAIVVLRGPVRTAVYGADGDETIQRAALGILSEAGIPVLRNLRDDTVIRHIMDNLVDPDELHNAGSAEIVRRGGLVIDAAAAELWRIATSDAVLSIEEEVQYGLCLDNARLLVGVDKAFVAGVTGKRIVVAVIDTGIDATHPAFARRISPLSRSFITNESATDYSDNDGHGTYVAGIIGGNGSPSGAYRGVAPGATLLVLKACNSAGARSGDIGAAINFASRSGAQVINLSSGYPGIATSGGPWVWSNTRTAEELALGGALADGIACIVAAGNHGPLQSTVTHPGVMQEVLTVGCADLNALQKISRFSSQGPAGRTSMISSGSYLPSSSPVLRGAPVLQNDKPDVVAPGGNRAIGGAPGSCATPHGTGVMSAAAAGATGAWRTCAHPMEPYTAAAGTSGATALVAGVCALALERISTLGIDLGSDLERATVLQNLIKATATDLGMARCAQGYGQVNWPTLSRLLDKIAAGDEYVSNFRIDPVYPR